MGRGRRRGSVAWPGHRFGPAWFRQAGLPDAPGTMLATVSGAVDRPGVYEIEVGTPIADMLAWGRVRDGVSAVLIGGYFGTWHELRAVAGLPMSAERMRRVGASPGAGVLIALPAAVCGLTETARVLGYLADQSAGQCGPCAFGLPAIAEDFAQLALGRPSGAVLERLDRRLGALPGRGACRHPDGAVRLAASALAAFAADAQAHARRMPCPAARRGAAVGGVLPIPRPRSGGPWSGGPWSGGPWSGGPWSGGPWSGGPWSGEERAEGERAEGERAEGERN